MNDEITINRKAYQLVNITITCSLPKYERIYMQSLVDRIANSGVTREDTHIIFTNPSRIITTYGADNHKMNPISMVTAEGSTRAVNREVIAI